MSMKIQEQHAANTPTNSPIRLGREALATPVKDIPCRTVAMKTPTSFLYRRFQKIGICLSHKSTIRYVDLLRKNLNEPVGIWSKEISSSVWKDNIDTSPTSELVINLLSSENLGSVNDEMSDGLSPLTKGSASDESSELPSFPEDIQSMMNTRYSEKEAEMEETSADNAAVNAFIRIYKLI
uniref:Uncharacterized protein n=1 Tax=Amphimedon queenslandica TaxID=400682 RepID=A0A1X7V7A7_AMPQE